MNIPMKSALKTSILCLIAGLTLPCSVSVAQDVTTKSANLDAAETANEETSKVFMPVDPPADAVPISGDLESMFDAMEASIEKSAKVFEELTVEQMNFRPADGSHTPRWNAEHLAGRQLQFFSQIYNAKNPQIPVVDINPKQMPDDYEFLHPQWTGAQEAERMRAVSQYCRRYAYLLNDIGLDNKPPAGRWPSLRSLLGTMDKHYTQHTGNVIKKMDAEGWPQ